jgi:hypothetical protein
VQGKRPGPLIHVAGNCVLNVLVPDVSLDASRPMDAWSSDKVQLLDRPVERCRGEGDNPYQY